MKLASSIEVIEEVLGRPLFEPEFRFRSYRDIPAALSQFPPPELTEGQFERIVERLGRHWSQFNETNSSANDRLLMTPATFTAMHRFPWGVDDSTYFEVSTAPHELYRDIPLEARRALLYVGGIVLRDPALLLAGSVPNTAAAFRLDRASGAFVPDDGSYLLKDREARAEAWRSVYVNLGMVYRLVGAGFVQLAPIPRWPRGGTNGDDDAESERLEKLYNSEAFKRLLSAASYFRAPKNLAHLGHALGQFALRNVECPGARAWISSEGQYRALVELEQMASSQYLTPTDIVLHRISTLAGIDPLKCSDEDFISMRSNEELFSLWRSIATSITFEAASHTSRSVADIRALVDSKQALWKSALDNCIGNGKFMNEIWDRNAIVCGLISGAAALAGGAGLAATGVAAAGGGFVVPLLNLLSDANRRGDRLAQQRSVTVHFMALGGSSR